jgi:hypothetical protein
MLPMEIQMGDRFTDHDFEWEVVTHPAALHGGKSLRARIQRPGALIGVLLAFWIESLRVRREATNLYGRLLTTSRSELAYRQPMCEKAKDHLKAGRTGVPLGSRSVPATTALLMNPMVHEKAPYSLIMALTILSADAEATEDALRRAQTLIGDRKLSPEEVVVYENELGNKMDQLEGLMVITLERLDLELGRLGVKVTVDPGTQEVSRKLLDVLQGPKR